MNDLQAGRELDALIAEKVMGYECVCDEEPADCPIHAKEDCYTLRPYSTDIAAAWVVIEWCRTNLNLLTTCIEWKECWDVTFSDGVNCYGAVAETVSLAICRAALKAVSKCE